MGGAGRRVLALGIGLVLGVALALLGLWALAYTMGATIVGLEPSLEATHLEFDPPQDVADCFPPRSGMLASASWGFEGHVPLVKLEVVAPGRVIEGAYSSHWAERRVLRISLSDDARGADFTPSFETDYGDFGGRVRGARSRAHRHGDRVCYDLSLERGEGRGSIEHWVGALALFDE